MMADIKRKVPNLRFKGFTDYWEQRKLSTLVTLHARIGWQNLRTSEFLDSGNYMLITGTDFNNGKIDYSKVHYVEKNRYDQDPKLQLHNGNILITKDGTIGKVAYVDRLKMPATLNAGVFNVTIKNKDETNNKYLFNYLNAPFLMKYATAESTGGTIKHLNQKVLVNFPVPISSIKEQNKISNLLEIINKLLSLQQRKLELLKQLKKGFLQKMFADKDSKQPILRFKGFHDDWEQRKLSKVKDVRDGTHDSPKYHEKGFPLITSKNLTPSGVDFSDASLIDEHDYQEINKRSLVEIHDILFGMIGTIGNPVIVKKSGFAIKNVALIKHGGNLSNYFLLNLLNSPIFAKYINKENAGGTQKFLSLSIIRNFRFLAPGSDEQNKIGNMFEQVDTFITLQQQKLAKYQSIKKSLLQQMFI